VRCLSAPLVNTARSVVPALILGKATFAPSSAPIGLQLEPLPAALEARVLSAWFSEELVADVEFPLCLISEVGTVLLFIDWLNPLFAWARACDAGFAFSGWPDDLQNGPFQRRFGPTARDSASGPVQPYVPPFAPTANRHFFVNWRFRHVLFGLASLVVCIWQRGPGERTQAARHEKLARVSPSAGKEALSQQSNFQLCGHRPREPLPPLFCWGVWGNFRQFSRPRTVRTESCLALMEPHAFSCSHTRADATTRQGQFRDFF